jgi:pimeloyl-ACP methyl ester carboxylesterase
MSTVQQTVTSKDGTKIAYEQSGTGPVVILVASSLADRSDTKRLAVLLASRFTVINYDRRGRGLSGDTPPYLVEREIEDIAALINTAGGSAYLFGSSSGAVLALKAAASGGLNITKLALYEPPFRVDESHPVLPDDLDKEIARFIAQDRRSEAVKLFMTRAVGVPKGGIILMRLLPGVWYKLTAMAHTIPYDITIMGGTASGAPLRTDDWAAVKAPTLVIGGEKSPAAQRNANRALLDVLPNARGETLAGQGHSAPVMAPKKLAPILATFFLADMGAGTTQRRSKRERS